MREKNYCHAPMLISTSAIPHGAREWRLSQILQIKVAIKLSINDISKHPVVGMGHS